MEVLCQYVQRARNNKGAVRERAPGHDGHGDQRGVAERGDVVHDDARDTVFTVFVALLAGGGYATHVVVHEDLALPVPEGLSWEEAGGLMEAACTVWSNLQAADARSGETLLVEGGSGGVGHLAIQVAVAMGMRVLATARGPERAARCAQETAGDFITGFGIAGDEMAGKPRDFRYSFDMAREAGLRLTAHAGEWGGAVSVRDAWRDLGVERIGHGVQAIDDLALVDELAEAGVVLECCPGSNVVLGVYPRWDAHPIEKLRARGVKVTVSTDDPPFFHTTMSAEYDRLAETFGWDADVFAEINRTALDAAFCDADTRARVAKRLESQDP